MARGFRGMKDDFMEIIHHIVGLSCCSVAHDDNYEGQLLPLPQPTVGDFVCLEASQVFCASNTEVRDAVAMEDDSRSTLDGFPFLSELGSNFTAGKSVTGDGLSFPQAEYVVFDGGLDPGFAAASSTPRPTFESEEKLWAGYNASSSTKLYEHDSESLSSSQTEREQISNPKILERNSSSRSLNSMVGNALEEEEEEGTSKERSFESASDIEDYYFYSRREGEDVSIQKHILVENHMPSISLSEGLQLRKRTNKNDEEIRDSHEVDAFEYVIV